MKKRNESVEDLRREAVVIQAWIRDVTAEKQARLHKIMAQLRGKSPKGGRKR